MIALEHLHRYAFASTMVGGKEVVDLSCGEGYGSQILSRTSKFVYGIDIDAASVAHASQKYPSQSLEFIQGDACSIPLEDNSVDAVISFETIEHVEHQDKMLLEIKRVLRSDGFSLISTPEKFEYNKQNPSKNPFHTSELSLNEFHELLKRHFSHIRMLGQYHLVGSAIFCEEVSVKNTVSFRLSDLPHNLIANSGLPQPLYLIAMCSNSDLPQAANSFCVQTNEQGIGGPAAKVRIGRRLSGYCKKLWKKFVV